MLRRGAGVVINVASVAAYAGDEACHAYPASKSALLALTRSWRCATGRAASGWS